MTAQLVLVFSKVSSHPPFQTSCCVLGFAQELIPEMPLLCYAPRMCKRPHRSGRCLGVCCESAAWAMSW